MGLKSVELTRTYFRSRVVSPLIKNKKLRHGIKDKNEYKESRDEPMEAHLDCAMQDKIEIVQFIAHYFTVEFHYIRFKKKVKFIFKLNLINYYTQCSEVKTAVFYLSIIIEITRKSINKSWT